MSTVPTTFARFRDFEDSNRSTTLPLGAVWAPFSLSAAMVVTTVRLRPCTGRHGLRD